MAFSGSSYVAGIGTVFAAVAFGVACGSMVTTSVVQPPNRLERLKSDAADHSKRDSMPPATASSSTEQASTTQLPSKEASPPPIVAAAPAPAADAQPVSPPHPTAPAAVKAEAGANIHQQSAAREQPAPAAKKPAPSAVAKSDDAAPAKDDAAPAKSDRAGGRSADSNRDAPRKKAATRKSWDDRKFSERRRRHDQDGRQLDEATNVVQPTPRDRSVGDMVEQDDGPRFGRRPHRFELFEDDDPPRRPNGPLPGLGFLFGD